MKPKFTPPFALIILLACSAVTTLHAASYSEAVFTRLEKDVKVLKENSPPHEAALGEQLKPVTSVATGLSSRAELRFPDKTLTRLGSNSRFTLHGEARTLDLDEGVMMLSVPKKMGGAKIRTSAVTAALTGTTVEIEFSSVVDRKTHKKREILKLLVIEGSVDLFRTNKPRDFITVPAGKMIIMDPNGPWTALVDFDVRRLRRTSPLLNEDNGPLPTSDHINKFVQVQQEKLNSGELIETALIIPGRGTQVTITTATSNNAIQTNTLLNAPVANTTPVNTAPANTAIVNNIPKPKFGPPLIPGFSVLNNTSTIKTDPFVTSWNSLASGDLTSQGAVYHGISDGFFSSFAFGSLANPSPNADQALSDLTNNFASNGLAAAYRFEFLIVNGSPVIDITAPTPAQVIKAIILAADHDIAIGQDSTFASSPHPGGTNPSSSEISLDIPSSLDAIAFWSNQGSINLKAGFQVRAGDSLSAINPGFYLVAASPLSDVTIEGGVQLYANNHGFGVEAGRDVNVLGSQAIINQAVSNEAVDMHAGRNLLVDGASITASKIYLAADAGAVTINNASLSTSASGILDNGLQINGGTGGVSITTSTLLNQWDANIYSFGGDVTVTNSTISSQTIAAIGGLGAIALTGSTITGNDVDIQNGSSLKDITITNTGITATGATTSLDLSLSIMADRDVLINMSNPSQIKNLSTDIDANFYISANNGKLSITGNGGGSGSGDTLYSGNIMVLQSKDGIDLTNMAAHASDIDINAGNGDLANAGSKISLINSSLTANDPAVTPSIDHGIRLHSISDLTVSIANTSQLSVLSTDPNAFLHLHSFAGNTSVTGNGGGAGAANTLSSGNRLELIAENGYVTLTNMAAAARDMSIQARGSTGSINLSNANLVVTDPAVIPAVEHGINLQAEKDTTINITDTSQIKLLSIDANAVLRIFNQTGDVSITGNGGGSSATDTLFSGNGMVIGTNGGNITLTNLVAKANDVQIYATGANSNVTLTNSHIVANAPASPPSQEHGISVNATKNVTINISDSSQLKVLASDPNSVLKLISGQGDISVTGNGSAADTIYSGNDIYIDASAGNVTLTNMVATAQNSFRARANGTSGILTVSGSTINAGNLIRLYAEGATGGVLFVGNVNLNTAGAVHISGNSVKVQTGGVVNIPTGNTDIFANIHDYNLNIPGNGTHGSINGPNITPHVGTGGRPTF